MISPDETIKNIKNKLGDRGRLAFLSTFIIGLLTHLSIMVSDIPNHDGLDSLYSDQNMITSGRWFLTIACGISSYFSLPWLIGILSLIYLGITAALITNLLNIRNKCFVVLSSAILVTFPSIASCFAYSFTMDGYMLGLLLCVLAVCLTSKYKWGFIPGAIALSFGIGIYQSYLCVAMILSLYMVALILMNSEKVKDKVIAVLKYAGMGGIGLSLYYIILNILLKIQGTSLGDYQGIDGMNSGNGLSLSKTIIAIYRDFLIFIRNGKIFIPNKLSLLAYAVLILVMVVAFLSLVIREQWYKKVLFYIFTVIMILLIPCVINAILVISAGVTYHLIMKYAYAMLGVLVLALIDYSLDYVKKSEIKIILIWCAFISGIVIAFSYAITDNIAYFNLQKKYEKTYAYCVRLADRIEETEGYYQGIPIAMVGVVGDVNFPETDITRGVTDNIIGATGDYLLYKGENYELFFKNYLGITFNILSEENVADFYYMDEYQHMSSFPDEGSTRVIDGVLYVKTENATY